jgi:hypothetical protein
VADSEVPMLVLGFGTDQAPASITQIKQLVLDHFGVGVARAA